MNNDVQHYKLSDRPKWWPVSAFKWLSIILAAFALFAFLVTTVLSVTGVFDTLALGDENSAVLNFGYFLDEAVWASLELLFYAIIIWFVARAIEKLDQLVWLNATHEDRFEILQKRKKKNAKNQ